MCEWIISELRQIVSFQKGRKVRVSEHKENGFEPYLGAGILSGGSVTEYAEKQGAILACHDDVLMLWDGERSGLVGKGMFGVVSSTVTKLSPISGIAPLYLYYTLSNCFEWIQARRTGTGVPHVPKDLGRILKISYPPISEQLCIAEILSTVDEAIEQTEAMIAKTQQIKAGLMHDLFTRGLAKAKLSSLPNTTNARTPYGFLPKGWAMGSLLDIADQSRQPILTGPFGADLGNDDFVEEGVPVLRIGNVQAGYLDLSDLLFISPRKASELQRYAIKSGDLLFARQGATTGRNALATQFVNDCIINYHIIRVALDHAKCSPSFIEAAFNQEIIKRQIEREKGRGTREGINTAQLKALKVPLAPLAEQRAIAEVLSGQNEVIQSLSDELSTLKNLRFGLMHDLLTGRVRVKTESVPPTESTHV